MFEIINFYKFHPIEAPQEFGQRWGDRARESGLAGTVLVAPEGHNLMLAGAPEATAQFLAAFDAAVGVDPAGLKRHVSERRPFKKLLVKVKPEIIKTSWQADLSLNAGTFIEPDALDEFARDPDVLFVDMRNDYEFEVGAFRGALPLPMNEFHELPQLLEHLEPYKQRKLVTYCTGGVRCEKAVPFLKSRGFEQVYQIHGGILAYLEKHPDGLWDGECFVFDERVTVTTRLERGGYQFCESCGQPAKLGAALCARCAA